MKKQTFIDNMTARGYELTYVANATDDETLRTIDVLTA